MPKMTNDLIALRIRLLVDMLDNDLLSLPVKARDEVRRTRNSILRLAGEVKKGEFL